MARILPGALLAIVIAAFVGTGQGAALPAASTTYSCDQVWGSFHVQLIGDREWGWNLGGLGAVGAPKKKSIVAVWSLGGYAAQNGLNVYGWATGSRSRPSSRCGLVKRSLKPATVDGLGRVTRVRDGWAFGRKFGCVEEGPLLITMTRTGSRTMVVVRLAQSGRVMGMAEVGGGGGWIRGSKRCSSSEK